MTLSNAWRLVAFIALSASLSSFADTKERVGVGLDLRGMSRIELAPGSFIVKGELKFPTQLLPDYWALIDQEDALLRRAETLKGMASLLNNENVIRFYKAQLRLLSEKYEDIAAEWDAIGLDGNAENARVLAAKYKALLEG